MVLGLMVWRAQSFVTERQTIAGAQSFVTERAGGYNILTSWVTSGWVAPYFSLGSARVIHSAPYSHWQASGCERATELWINLRMREGFGGLCARQRCRTCPDEHDLCCAGLVCIRMTVIYGKMLDALMWNQIQPCAHPWYASMPVLPVTLIV